MKFFKTILNAIYSPEFYQSVLKNTFGRALGYYVLLSLLLSILSLAFLLPSLYSAQKEIPRVVKNIVNAYPSNLEVKIKDGMASSNVEEPYFIALPDSEQDSKTKNILVIDTKTPFTTSQFNTYSTVAWLTKDAVIYRSGSQNSEFRVYSLSKSEDLTINRKLVENVAGKIMPFIPFIFPLVSVLIVLGLFFLSFFRLIHLLLIALLIWVLAKIMKWNFSYGKSYIISFYAITLPLILDFMISNTDKWTGFRGFPLMFTLVTLFVVFLNYSTQAKTKTTKKK